MTATQVCPYPYLFGGNRCCMCRGKVNQCPCGPQDAINRFVTCHIADNCDVSGHPSVAEMVMLGMPAPTEPCRKCGEVITLVLMDE